MEAKDELDSINVKRVLDKVIQEPMRTYTYDDFRDLRQYTGWSRIVEAVKHLREKRMLEISPLVGAPPKKSKKKDRRDRFQLSGTMTTFKKIFQIYSKRNEIDPFLKSKYVNHLIERQSFVKVHEKVMRHHLEKSDFRRIASDSLLNLPAVIDEYDEMAEQLKRNILKISRQPIDTNKIYLSDILHDTGDELSSSHIKHIDILNSYEPLMAVRLYRKTLHKSILEAYDKLAAKAVITEGLHRFLAFDNYLSPLIAHPVNSTLKVLFSRPFERIYEDAYLLDGESFQLLSSRAAAIYCNFPDVLFELLKTSTMDQEELTTTTMRMIDQWNVASTRFDIVCIQLSELYKEKIGSGNYHLRSDGLVFNIVDLEDSKKLLPLNVARSILMVGSSPKIFEHSAHDEMRSEDMKNSFESLRPCLTFADMGWRSDFIPIEDILSELESKFAEHDLQSV